MDFVPIVVSVPKKTKCLSGVDTIMCLDAVGALDMIVALELVASVAAEFHSNTSPSTIKQIALSPKIVNGPHTRGQQLNLLMLLHPTLQS